MRFKIWLHWTKIKKTLQKVYYSTLLVFIRGTLTYNVCKMLMLIFTILWILFKFVPHIAYINYYSNQIEYIKTIVDLALIELETNRFSISDLGTQKFDVLGAEISSGGQNYGSEYSIMIKPYIEHEGVVFVKKDCDFNIKLHTKTYTDSSYALFNYLGNQTIIKSAEGVQIEIKDEVMLDFGNADVFLVKEGDAPIQIFGCEIKPMDNNVSFIFNTGTETTVNILQYTNDYVHSKANISLYGIRNSTIQSSGEMDFSYTPNAQRYNINNQLLYLENSADGQINASLEKQGLSELYLFGHVKKAFLSGFNLFPTFKGWFQSNIYVIPLTLLSTIFGGIILMIKNKK